MFLHENPSPNNYKIPPKVTKNKANLHVSMDTKPRNNQTQRSSYQTGMTKSSCKKTRISDCDEDMKVKIQLEHYRTIITQCINYEQITRHKL